MEGRGQVSQSDRLLDLLEQEIAHGRLQPGARLDERSLAALHGVSRTPVREALQKLAVQGFIEIKARQGAAVVQLSVPDLIQMFEIMSVLEGLCARLAARRMTTSERAELGRLQKVCQEGVEAGDPDRYYDLNMAFHEAIYAGCHNPHLQEMTRRMRNRLSYYRRNQLHYGHRVASSHAEHWQVVHAITKGDDEAAEALMRRHINVQGDGFSDLISSLPAKQQ
jgi:DNA-binding GntR family transcriptional regulator